MPNNRKQPSLEKARQRNMHLILIATGFLLGSFVTTAVILNLQVLLESVGRSLSTLCIQGPVRTLQVLKSPPFKASCEMNMTLQEARTEIRLATSPSSSPSKSRTLQDIRILVAIAAFDFNQIPHLESVLDSYHDICVAGARVDVVVHATIPYPVTFIDLLNSRFTCDTFSIQIVLKSTALRLHLVDCHRQLFYDRIQDYDLFIYTEEDIQVTPRTVATYLQESQYIQETLANSMEHSFSDFNVGIVRYEFNYPSNVVIDDKTRHATKNVTRVYWEHSSFEPPLIPNAMDVVPQGAQLAERYVYMKNHHQGMFLATRELLLAWKARSNCNFHIIKNRPGRRSQPTEGTQRVWMSSHQLLSPRHCNVQQVLPKDKFGALTVLHLPNKNYRRVGKYRKREFSDGTEEFDQSPDLLSALQLHLAMRKAWPPKPQPTYRGTISMIDDVESKRTPLLERRLKEYRDYVNRGGVLSDYDFTRTLLLEDE
jgi:hypothetical protein